MPPPLECPAGVTKMLYDQPHNIELQLSIVICMALGWSKESISCKRFASRLCVVINVPCKWRTALFDLDIVRTFDATLGVCPPHVAVRMGTRCCLLSGFTLSFVKHLKSVGDLGTSYMNYNAVLFRLYDR